MQEEVLAQLKQKEKEAGGDASMWEKKKEDLLQKRRDRSSSKDNTNVDKITNSIANFKISNNVGPGNRNDISNSNNMQQRSLAKAAGIPNNINNNNNNTFNSMAQQQQHNMSMTVNRNSMMNNNVNIAKNTISDFTNKSYLNVPTAG